jgi:Flp pilus assembly protein TadG
MSDSKKRHEDGQALAEFAMVLPLLILLVLGLFEFARAWNTLQVMTDAAREAARRSVVHTTPPPNYDSVIETAQDALARAGLDPEKGEIDATVQGTSWPAARGTPVTVTLSYPYEFKYVGTLLSWATGSSAITLRTSAIMRKE